MSYFMIGYKLTFFLGKNSVFFLLTNKNLLYSFHKVFLRYIITFALNRINSSFIDHIGKV